MLEELELEDDVLPPKVDPAVPALVPLPECHAAPASGSGPADRAPAAAPFARSP